MRSSRALAILITVALLAPGGPAFAQAERSLDKCQRTVGKVLAARGR